MSARGKNRRALEVIRLRVADAMRELGCGLQHLDQIDLGNKPSILDELESAAKSFAEAGYLLAEAEKLCDEMKKETA